MQLFDIGANLTHSAFQADLAQTVERARAAGVTRIIVTGTTVDETMAASHVAEQFGLAYAPTYGIVFTFVIMALVLAFRPQGILGRRA